MIKISAVIAGMCILVSCGNAPTETNKPPLPDGVETVDFDSVATPKTEDVNEPQTAPVYWGVKEGEPLTIMWEDLMPDGSEEALMREYEQFYDMLEKRYAANSTSLADATPYGKIEEGSEFDYMPQLGTFDTVTELNETLVRIPGYVVPFDFERNMRHREFLFVPYMGACIHTPPPPPNQIIFVRADPAIQVKDIWAPYWIEGTLLSEKTENEVGDTAYVLELDQVEPYDVP